MNGGWVVLGKGNVAGLFETWRSRSNVIRLSARLEISLQWSSNSVDVDRHTSVFFLSFNVVEAAAQPLPSHNDPLRRQGKEKIRH